MKIGENIRDLRRKSGMNQMELAQLLGYTDRSSIAKIETGKVDISQTKLRQLADIFAVPVRVPPGSPSWAPSPAARPSWPRSISKATRSSPGASTRTSP